MMRFRPGEALRDVLALFVLGCIFLVAPVALAQDDAAGSDESQAEEVQEAEMVDEETDEGEETEAEPMPPPPPPAAEESSEHRDLHIHPTGPHYPPSTGKMVGDHWTPYDPPDPETFPPGAEIHIIVVGDTLWDLAEMYLEDPMLWPQVWDVNQYILDSHWIYPGDPILLPGAPTVIAEAEPEMVPEEAEEPEAEPEPEPVDELVQELQEEPAEPVVEMEPPPMAPPPALRPMADNADVYCSNYIDSNYEEPELIIAEKEEGAKSLLAPGDIVFLNQGAEDGIQPGQQFSIIEPALDVWHPADDESYVGLSVNQIGRLQVLAVQDRSATAQITMGCDAVEVGDPLVPFEEVAVPVVEPPVFDPFAVEITGENQGFVVHGRDVKLSYGQGDIVNIDMGSLDGVEPGKIFTVYREWAGSVEFASTETYIDGRQQRAQELRERAEMEEDGEVVRYSYSVIGQLVVVGARDTTATAKVVVAAKEISIGDRVALQ